MLHFQPAGLDQPLEKLPVAQKLHAVTPASLVPASEPEEGHDFLSAPAALGKLVPFSGGWTERPSRPRLLCVRSPDGRGSEHMLYCSGTAVFGTVWG